MTGIAGDLTGDRAFRFTGEVSVLERIESEMPLWFGAIEPGIYEAETGEGGAVFARLPDGKLFGPKPDEPWCWVVRMEPYVRAAEGAA